MEVHDTPPVLEDELMNMADTQMRAQFSTRTLHDHFEMIRSGITGRS
jgi:flagellar basal-body rod protein FlgB